VLSGAASELDSELLSGAVVGDVRFEVRGIPPLRQKQERRKDGAPSFCGMLEDEKQKQVLRLAALAQDDSISGERKMTASLENSG
jgi:hypothetical protein